MEKDNTFTGVANPYALAEIVLGRKINWKQISNKARLLESVFKMPYNDIFDSNSASPIFAFYNMKTGTGIQPPISKPNLTQPQNDLDTTVGKITTLAELVNNLNIKDTSKYKIRVIEQPSDNRLLIELEVPVKKEQKLPATALPEDVIRLIGPFKEPLIPKTDAAWQPENVTWSDFGHFFHEAAEFSDPIQGGIGNCYFIAALASVAWAMPDRIIHKTRATGYVEEKFVNIINFHNDTGAKESVEVTDKIAIRDTTGLPVGCRSAEAGEIWPSVYEKAYAKWLVGTNTDMPDITQTAGGSVFVATEQITGIPEWHYPTNNYSGDDLWDMVRENSLSRRTFNPMGTCTTSEMLIQQQGLTYVGTGIVPGHAYSILGWDYKDGNKYIILRNPWGQHEATIDIYAGITVFYDISWWRNIDMTNPDGVFGIEVNTFKQYFNYIGGAKE